MHPPHLVSLVGMCWFMFYMSYFSKQARSRGTSTAQNSLGMMILIHTFAHIVLYDRLAVLIPTIIG